MGAGFEQCVMCLRALAEAKVGRKGNLGGWRCFIKQSQGVRKPGRNQVGGASSRDDRGRNVKNGFGSPVAEILDGTDGGGVFVMQSSPDPCLTGCY
jgi:hypothetical protein